MWTIVRHLLWYGIFFLTKNLFQRITGLDPAGPMFFPDLPMIMPDDHLSENDAHFVDIVHTDTGGYGYPLTTGTADFYVNSGYRFQPGCGTDRQSGKKQKTKILINPFDAWVEYRVFIFGLNLFTGGSCSHNRAIDFFVESVLNNRSFYAVGVKESNGWTSGWKEFKDHEIDEENIVLMGIACPETADGRYYLQTNKASPFGRGMNGIHYNFSLVQ